ncbi:MAG: hypothetical protein INR69_17130 [Mucilaginibacter polytrichastri]|nr:hypothetical protein [Mucilaginibacter polytrichastri]
MKPETTRTLARVALGAGLVFAGISHLTFARKDFQAQVPDILPLKKDDTVIYSGFVEIALGAGLILAGRKKREVVGNIAATFFTVIFPGNMAQFVNRKDAFGLDTSGKRFTRLLFQPALVYWAWKSTRVR